MYLYFLAGNPEYYNTVAYSQYNPTPYTDPQWRAYPTGIISKCLNTKHKVQSKSFYNHSIMECVKMLTYSIKKRYNKP